MDRNHRRAVLGAAVAVVVAAAAERARAATASPADASPVAVEEIARTQADGQPLRGWVARVDLRDPRVSFVVPGPLEARSGDPASTEARLVPLDSWARGVEAVLAVNANYFRRPPGAAPGPWAEGEAVDIVGLSVSGGLTVSPARREVREPDPALLIDEAVGTGEAARCPCRAEVRRVRSLEGRRADEAVSGMGSEAKGEATLLVDEGRNRGATARVQPLKRHPRTAAGVTRDGRTLLLVVVDGRQPGWSAGATLVELADLMRGLGAWTALNLDGGGSSALWWRAPGEAVGRIRNRPSDGRVRPIANALGVRVVSSAGSSP